MNCRRRFVVIPVPPQGSGIHLSQWSEKAGPPQRSTCPRAPWLGPRSVSSWAFASRTTDVSGRLRRRRSPGPRWRIRELTRRTLGLSLPQLVEQLAPYLVGWRGYFGFCDAPRVLANLDAWIRRRLRMYLWRQWQSGRHRFQELRRRGVSQFHAAVAAGSPTGFWRMSRHPAVQQALRNAEHFSVGGAAANVRQWQGVSPRR